MTRQKEGVWACRMASCGKVTIWGELMEDNKGYCGKVCLYRFVSEVFSDKSHHLLVWEKE